MWEDHWALSDKRMLLKGRVEEVLGEELIALEHGAILLSLDFNPCKLKNRVSSGFCRGHPADCGWKMTSSACGLMEMTSLQHRVSKDNDF
mmetsp:Transcript_34677/g.136700  ORF Transcript_34677/g.136700 Transcript_34677/m.136700 type:complete len:90 (-) Transcript_34677:2684-2953(-)